jgi:hypothetical protein
MEKILTLPLFESNSISQRFGINQKGVETGSVMITETDFSGRANTVKAKKLIRDRVGKPG